MKLIVVGFIHQGNWQPYNSGLGLQVVKHWWAITGGNQWPKENLA
jgi:hypothetical protein